MRLVVGDIADPEVADALGVDADAVVHYAAESHTDNALADPSPFVHTNRIRAAGPPTRCTATSIAVLRILESGRMGETYLIGADGERYNLEVVQTILRLMGQGEDAFDHVQDRAGHDLRYAIDATRLREELGWEASFTDFESGLSDTIDWYRANEAWWRPQKAAAEAKYAQAGH